MKMHPTAGDSFAGPNMSLRQEQNVNRSSKIGQ